MRKFQKYKNFFVGDVKKAFIIVEVHEQDRDFLHFRWFELDAQEKRITVFYTFQQLPWGIICAPFCLQVSIDWLLDAWLKDHYSALTYW